MDWTSYIGKKIDIYVTGFLFSGSIEGVTPEGFIILRSGDKTRWINPEQIAAFVSD